MSETTPTPVEDLPDASAAPTECTYDESLKEYLKCNKQRFSTTQLVGAGIGVTIVIFALAFGLIWFCRRKRTPKSRSKTKDRERQEAKRNDDENSVIDESDVDMDSDDGDDHHNAKAKEAGFAGAKDAKGLPPVPNDAPNDSGIRRRPSDAKSIKSVRAPPTARPGDELKIPTRNGLLSAPTSRASSHAGSPVESRSIRNLYPSNPDNTPRSTLYGAPPGPGSRPTSTYSHSGRPVTQHDVQPPMPTHQPRQGKTGNHRPVTSSGLKPLDHRAHPSRSSSVTGGRRPSIAPSDRSSGVLPTEDDGMETMTRTASVRSNNEQRGYDSVPTKRLADRPSTSRSGSTVSTASRPASRMSVASRKSSYAPISHGIEPAVPPPPYPAGEVLVRPRPARSGTLVSQMGEARMSSTASIKEDFVDAHESLEAMGTPPLNPRRPQPVRASSALSTS